MKPYYQDADALIFHADCKDVIDRLPRFDALVIDPPYGIGEASNNNASRGKLAVSRDYGSSTWDDQPVDWPLLQTLIAKAKHAIIFGGNYYPMPPSPCWLVWDKDNGATDFADCELAWTNLDKAVRRLKWRWQGFLQQEAGKYKEARYHPTQKPEAVMSWAISHLPKDVITVVDTFMGSGTTLIAARQHGKKAIGIEREERYCEVAANRLRATSFLNFEG